MADESTEDTHATQAHVLPHGLKDSGNYLGKKNSRA
jgi:hypothetical protein